jgi:hypothetical protein
LGQRALRFARRFAEDVDAHASRVDARAGRVVIRRDAAEQIGLLERRRDRDVNATGSNDEEPDQ